MKKTGILPTLGAGEGIFPADDADWSRRRSRLLFRAEGRGGCDGSVPQQPLRQYQPADGQDHPDHSQGTVHYFILVVASVAD